MGSNVKELLVVLSNSQGNLLDDEKLIEKLTELSRSISEGKSLDSGFDLVDELKVELSSKLSDAEVFLGKLEDELNNLKPVLKNATQEAQEMVLRAQETQETALRVEAQYKDEQVTRVKQSLEGKLTEANNKLMDLLRHSKDCNAKGALCTRLRHDMKKTCLYLKGCYAVTVLTKLDGGNMAVSCLNVAGEELIPAQPMDVTYGALREAVIAVAPDVYVMMVTPDGRTLSDDTPESQLVIDML